MLRGDGMVGEILKKNMLGRNGVAGIATVVAVDGLVATEAVERDAITGKGHRDHRMQSGRRIARLLDGPRLWGPMVRAASATEVYGEIPYERCCDSK